MISLQWHGRFLDLAKLVSTWSKDPSTKCGAVIVRPDKTIASVGFNGFPKGCSDREELYSDREQKLARVVHAEMNAILHAREPLNGYTMYMYQNPLIGHSCDRCSAHVIQAGIKEVVCYNSPVPERYKESIERGIQMYREAGITILYVGERLCGNAK